MNYAKFYLVLFILFGITSYAQIFSTGSVQYNLEQKDAKSLTLGFYLGYNFLQYSIETNPEKTGFDYPTVDTETNGGFNVGLILKKRINDYFDARFEPGVLLVDRTITFSKLNPSINPVSERKKPSTFVYVPILLEVHGNRYKNSRPYLGIGAAYLYNLQSDEKSTNDNQNGTFRTKASNFAAQAELGVTLYFEKFKLTPSVKGLYFLTNEYVPDKPTTLQQAETITDIRTSGIMLSLKFE
jgi:hypothetical protein